ncbi:hypothetical protein SOVF_184550 [Spinacia oleracea]|nr:hypothetical protein SOVF_184550 [Spinacia oleracea]
MVTSKRLILNGRSCLLATRERGEGRPGRLLRTTDTSRNDNENLSDSGTVWDFGCFRASGA